MAPKTLFATVGGAMVLAIAVWLAYLSSVPGLSTSIGEEASGRGDEAAVVQRIVGELAREGESLPGARSALILGTRPTLDTAGASSTDPEWVKLERNDRNVVALFLRAAPAVKSQHLLRNMTLNPADDYIRPKARVALDAIITSRVAHIVKAMKEASSQQHRELLRLAASGALTPVTRATMGDEVWEKAERATKAMNGDSPDGAGQSRRALRSRPQDYLVMHADDMIPGGAAAFLDTRDGTFIARKEQLRSIAPITEYVEFEKEEFLLTVVAWFQDLLGCVNMQRIDSDLQAETRRR